MDKVELREEINERHSESLAHLAQSERIGALEAKLMEMTRRRDEWRRKADGYEDVRLALREKVGAPWPPNLSRALWAGLAADEKKRADDAEAKLAKAREGMEMALSCTPFVYAGQIGYDCGDPYEVLRQALKEIDDA